MFMIIALVGLFAYPAMILLDVHRHPPVHTPVPVHAGAMTAQGVPYVPGPQHQSYSAADLREIARAEGVQTTRAFSREALRSRA